MPPATSTARTKAFRTGCCSAMLLAFPRIDRAKLFARLLYLAVSAATPLRPCHLTDNRVGRSVESTAEGGGKFARNRQRQNDLVTAPRLFPFAKHIVECHYLRPGHVGQEAKRSVANHAHHLI